MQLKLLRIHLTNLYGNFSNIFFTTGKKLAIIFQIYRLISVHLTHKKDANTLKLINALLEIPTAGNF